MEPQAAAIAAKNASFSDLQAIAEAHRHANDAHQTDEFEHWDTLFHQRLFAATRNELLASIHDILQVIRSRNAWIELKRKSFSENRRRDYCAQHGNVVAALENRDADGAAQAMLRSHRSDRSSAIRTAIELSGHDQVRFWIRILISAMD